MKKSPGIAHSKTMLQVTRVVVKHWWVGSWRARVVISVTSWLYHLFNIWPSIAIKKCPMAQKMPEQLKNVAKYSK